MDSQKVLGAMAEAGMGVLKDGAFKAWDDDKPKPQGGSSLASIISAFVPTWTTAILFIGIFAMIRHRFPKIYAPRTYIGTVPEKDRTPSASRGWFDWAHTMRVVPDKFILYHQSLDSYLYLRFLRTMIFILFVGCCITWPILMPINATGGGNSLELDKISIGNVSKRKHLYAHAVVAWVFFGFVMFTIVRERVWLIGLRQAWNLSKPHANRLSSRVVLFLSAPKDSLSQEHLSQYFGNDAVRCWPATKAEKLQSLASSRNTKVEELEGAEVSLIQNANKKGRQGQKKSGNRNGSQPSYGDLPDTVKKTLRPTQRLKTPPVGKQVDSIDWLRSQITEKQAELEKARESYEAPDTHGGAAVFVEFKNQAAAQAAYQQVASAEILALTPRYTGVLPKEVIWDNLVLPPARRVSQEGIATAIVVATIIFWSIPVSFVAAWSNASYLASRFKWLSWLNNLPDPILGLITGLLPPLLTSLLSKYIPNIFRYIFKSFGEPTNTSAELKVQKWYYVFQVVQVFLVTTLSAGAAAVVAEIVQDPTSVPAKLAEHLPSAANFYYTYFIIQGTTSSADNILNYSDLLSWLFFDRFMYKTPRQKYNGYISMKGIAWGKVYPKYTNFAIIAIAYACVAPLVMGFAALGLLMFYLSYKYMLLYTVEPKIDTKGHAYTLALQQLLTGVYLAELCLIGLFGFRQATGPSIMTIILFIVTVIYNVAMNRYLLPLEQFLPADVVAESEDGDENAPLLSSAEEGQADSHIMRLGQQAHVPAKLVDPIARFFEPRVFANRKAMRTWLRKGDFDEDDVPVYKAEEIENAYKNPAFTSKTPLVWLPKDDMGVSKNELGELESEGLQGSDQGAWIDKDGNVRWSETDFAEVPLFKEGVRY